MMQPNLSLTPEIVNAPSSAYVYLEKRGEIGVVARSAWDEFEAIALGKLERDRMEGQWALTLVESQSGSSVNGVYQAGFAYRSEPSKALPDGLRVRRFDGGRYAKFVLKGSFKQLPLAYPLAIERTMKAGLRMRHAFFMETYSGIPDRVPESELVTEIYVPIE